MTEDLLRRVRRSLAIVLMAAGAVLLAGSADAAEITRETYREAVEPICRVNSQANERIFKGVRTMVRRGELNQAADRFDKAAKALTKTVAQLRRVPRPPADEARLAKWLDRVFGEATLFQTTAGKLRAGKKSAALRMVVKLTSLANRANALVVPFEFRYCRLNPARFT
jgi:hypothetical protein